MTRRILILVVIAAITLSLSARENAEWRYSQRDVYIDGVLDRSALVFTSAHEPRRTLLVTDSLRHAALFEQEDGRVLTVSKGSLVLSDDLMTAGLRGGDTARIQGTYSETPDHLWIARIGNRRIIVKDHESPSGSIDSDQLFRDFPAWDALRRTYVPDSTAVDRIAREPRPLDVTVVFATWCGDSRREVPRIVRTLEEAANDRVHVQLVGIDGDFHSPMDVIMERQIINVPTIIVVSEGKELGRMVETPASPSVEEELVDILDGTQKEHPGRWARETRLASGSYVIRSVDGSSATEDWEIFATAGDGRLAHSTIRTNGLTREVWHRFDENRKSFFVQITDETPDGLRRTRFWQDGDSISAHSRSDLTGIVDQTIGTPPSCAFTSSAVSTMGWECLTLDGEPVRNQIARYVVGFDACEPIGSLETLRVEPIGKELITIDGRERSTWHIALTSRDNTTHLWIDEEGGIPVRLLNGTKEATVTRLERG